MNRLILPSVTISVPSFEAHAGAFGSTSSPKNERVHRHSFLIFALFVMLLVGAAIEGFAFYESSQIRVAVPATATSVHASGLPSNGPNTVITQKDLDASIKQITSQKISLVAAGQTVTVSRQAIQSWLQIVKDSRQDVAYIHVKKDVISSSIKEAAAPFIKAPINQVTTTHPGAGAHIVVAGQNGTQLGDTSTIAAQIGSNLLQVKGMQFNLPLQTLPFQAVTPAAFDKLLEVNTASKQMWAYQNGKIIKTFLVSAGKPSTPTPLGEYHVYAKYSVQDMWGYNPNGTKYFQPHVRWISYFTGGNAVHGVYWHPLSWFGAINSSHGCVGVPDYDAEWVYDWAPVGTTVITHV